MLPKQLSTLLTSKQKSKRTKDWRSYKKLWRKYKIIRNQAKKSKEPKDINELKKEEIIIAKKIVKIAKTLTDKNGNDIPIPFFPILGHQQ